MSTPETAIYIQDACYKHSYIRSKDTSAIVERPERLRAVKMGLAAAIAHLETYFAGSSPNQSNETSEKQEDALADALANMRLATAATSTQGPVSIVHSSVSVDLLNNEAVKFVHGDIDGDVYLENLKSWASSSRDKIANGSSEIPEGFNQGDLYLCPESIEAIQGALGTTCEAVDAVMDSATSSKRAFVAVRPPGHHCGEDTPSGFCFVNNVAVAAAHAHLKHGINRVVILDIDLHHGNGTQSIVWQINEETYRQSLEVSEGEGDAGQPSKPGLQVYYGSLHDILSYPCEDGKPNLVQAASVSLHGAHGQHIENVHLEPYISDEGFWDIYERKYTRIIDKAEAFLSSTSSGSEEDDAMVFISCGMDACEHEYASMSRHGRKVPTSFYYNFTRDACALAERHKSVKGRVVSVLEGGYSDRALASGGMAHLCGMALAGEVGRGDIEGWWSLENLTHLEKATAKKRRSARPSLQNSEPPLPAPTPEQEKWLGRTLSAFATLEPTTVAIPRAAANLVPTSDRTLRDRKPKSGAPSPNPGSTPKRGNGVKSEDTLAKVTRELESVVIAESGPGQRPMQEASTVKEEVRLEVPVPVPVQEKKLPRVVLKLGPRRDA